MRSLLLLPLVLLLMAVHLSTAFATDVAGSPLTIANDVQLDSYSYSPVDRRDPFTPLVQEKSEVKDVVVDDPRSGTVKGPLEKYELSQFRLIAIVVIKGIPNAMVATTDGKSYRVKVGDYIGSKSGLVKGIETKVLAVDENGMSYEKNPDRIVVMESGYNRFTKTRVTEKRFIEL